MTSLDAIAEYIVVAEIVIRYMGDGVVVLIAAIHGAIHSVIFNGRRSRLTVIDAITGFTAVAP